MCAGSLQLGSICHSADHRPGRIALWRPPFLAVAQLPVNGGHPTLPLAMHCHRPGRNYANRFESDRLTCENSLLSGVNRKRDRSESTAVAVAGRIKPGRASTAAGTAYAMLPGGPAGTMCSESLWVANPELPLLCLPGPYQNVGAQEQRGLCSGVRDLAGASPYGARRWPFPTAIYWLEIPHLGGGGKRGWLG